MKITTFYLYHAGNEAHYQFLSKLKGILERYPAVADIVSSLMPEFNRLLDVEKSLVDPLVASDYTEQIAAADRNRDRALAGLSISVRSLLHHNDPEVIAAAVSLRNLLKSFRNLIGKKSYSEESTAVEVLVDDLRGETYAPMLAKLGLTGWVPQLDAAQNEFQTLFKLRAAEMTARPKERMVDVRKQLEVLYRDIVRRIMAYTVLNDGTDCAGFIDELNYLIAYFKQHGHHQAKKDLKKADIRSIPNQVYTGVPVTVLPEVFFGEEELVFTEDYEVTYEYNHRPGSALLIVHGKGAYKGKKLISFNIVKPGGAAAVTIGGA